MKPISFAEALRDIRLLGASFRGVSWRPWHVLAKIISGQPLDDSEMALVLECTGRRMLPKNPPRRLYLLVGRRGGKSRFLSALAVWVAAQAANWRNLMAPGEPAVVMLVACDKKQAAVLRRYADGLLQAPLLAPEVVRRTEERIELRSGAVLEITTNDHRLIRGRSAVAVLGDEVSFWRADGESSSSDEEVITAAAPSLMTAPGGGYLVLSSTTYRKRGLMFDPLQGALRQGRRLHGAVARLGKGGQATTRRSGVALPAWLPLRLPRLSAAGRETARQGA